MYDRALSLPLVLALAAVILLLAGTCLGQHFTRTDLTADMAATSPTAANLDPNLVNAWGLTRGSASPFWVSDNGTGVSTLHNGAGVPQQLVVTIPTANGTGTSAPTGAIFNYSGKGFEVAKGSPAIFMFCTEDGTIAAWNPKVNPTNAVLKVKRGGKAIYKGCTLAQKNNNVFLFAANFQTGNVDVFDSNFNLVHTMNLNFFGSNFAPFGIQNVGGNLVVTFAKRTPGSRDEQHGPGLGAVGIFNSSGHLLVRLERGSFLNAPWGIALAPADFGPFNHRLIIGNFGDGTINAFNATTGAFEGKLLGASGSTPLTIDGLWALVVGGGATNNGSATALFFTAGPNSENNGLFGKITSAVASEQRGSME
jgi:uncharacterized protein (TIGR03118 family)